MAKIRLFTPGPTPVPEQVMLEMAQPMDHHRTSQYQEVLGKVLQGLKYVFQTKNDVLLFTSSGTGSMEGAIVCTAQPGKKTLIVQGGKFGERWGEVCAAFDIPNIIMNVEWGKGADPAAIEKQLKDDPAIGAVVVVHCETSTAAASNIEAIAKVITKTPAVFIVDAISSAGAMPIKVDEWGIDIVCTGSQKALMLPPGLAFAIVSDKAWKIIEANKPKAFYFDYRAYRKAIKETDTPYTSALTLVKGLNKSLEMIQKEGIEKIWARVSKLAAATRAAFPAMGVKLYPQDPADSVTAFWMPDGIDEAAFRKTLRAEFGVHLAAGQGKIKGKVVRLTNMGYIDQVDIIGALSAIEIVLTRMGHKFTIGAGLAAAQKILCQ